MQAVKKSTKEAREQRKQLKETRKLYGRGSGGRGGYGRGVYGGKRRIGGGFSRGDRVCRGMVGGVRNTDIFKKNNQPKLSHEEKRVERAKKAFERFNRDSDFKFLHDRVSDYFAECLRSDMKMLESGRLNKISLAAKMVSFSGLVL
ncbi:hypothetical protein PHJA_001771700 [Phtheirospermum japonicum]|uniref:DUF2828 domain-containing protein n=1 Tax=Phtheirospermum japonicum TaxID=374723 RepID=A0A830CAQ9_9LAMI|nr:hypothetical protein PHJA_001771700 [Phtheirospermum japonicum]